MILVLGVFESEFMSTKSSLKWKDQSADGPGYHLYEDVMDFEKDPPVYLRLDGVQVDLETSGENGASVLVVIPKKIAAELGLLTPNLPAKGRAESASSD